jgi:hypothetical protein
VAKPNQQDPYEVWLSRLSPQAKKALTSKKEAEAPDDEKEDFDRWRSGLSPQAQQWTDGQTEAGESRPDEELLEGARYGCVECPDGEFPVVRLFKTEEALARHVGGREGKDVSIVPFYGHFLRFSKGPQRYMFSPGGEKLVLIPRDGIGPVRSCEADLVEFDWQEDGFVGPPELADTSYLEKELEDDAAKYVTETPDHVDEDDDEEEGEGAYE